MCQKCVTQPSKSKHISLCAPIQSGQTSDGEDDRSDDHDKRLQSVSVDDSSEAAYEAKGNLLLAAPNVKLQDALDSLEVES